MSHRPPAGGGVEPIRRRFESMAAEVAREKYEVRAGLRADSRLAAILDRYRDLGDRETLARVEDRRSESAAGGDGEEERRLRLLAEALAGCYEEQRLAEITDRLNRLESSLAVEVDGEAIPFQELQGRVHTTADRDRRRAYHRALLEALSGPLHPLHRARLEIARRSAAELGYSSYTDFVSRTSGMDLDRLQRQIEPLLDRTRGVLRDLVADALRRSEGIPLAAAESHDVNTIFRAAEFDAYFPAGGEVALAREIVERGLGLDLTAGGRIRIDIEPRAAKTPRAFCSSVQVPSEIYLVTKPAGGQVDYTSFLHELGHALHFAHVDPAQPLEYRRLGDNSVTEGYAVLFDGILRDRVWAERRIGRRHLGGYLAHAALQDLWMYCRYAAKLSYELELWAADGEAINALADRYVALLGAVAGVPADRERFLADVDLHFYAARHLRAWLLAALLRARLRSDFGDAWFESRRAGRFLRELWALGQKLDAEELARELGAEGLGAEPLLEEVGALAR